MAAAPLNGLLIDAYAVQHPGKPSAQAIQSVAVHALVLHGVLERKMSPDQALWIRRRALREGGVHKHERYRWLDPPDFSGSLTIVDVVKGTDPVERARTAADYIHAVWKEWAARHGETLSAWFVDNVLA